MADLSRVGGFKFNSTTVDNMLDDDVYLLDVDKSAVSELQYISFDLPNRDGILTVPDKYSAKLITVTVGIWALTAQERREKERELLKDITGKEGRLIFLDEPTLFYKAQVYDSISRKEETVWTKLSITFICSPFMYELYGDLRDEFVSETQKLANDDGTLINTSSWQNVTESFTETVINGGNYKALPEIYFFGSADLITFRVNNQEFSFSSLDGYVYVDCENMVVYTIENNKKKSLLTQFTGVFPEISSGENTVAIGGSNLNLTEIQLNFPNTYIV